MRILVICQYYYPEPFRLNAICEELIRRGHTVQVVTGEPNYPEGTIYSGYEHHQKSNEIINGVKVHRCPIIPRKTGTFFRLLNYYSYPLSSSKYIKQLGNDFDIVFVNQLSPVMMAKAGIVYSRKWHKPIILYCMDLWPDSLTSGGITKESAVYRYFYRVSKEIYTRMDKIFVSSRQFKAHISAMFSIDESKISSLPQYAEEVFDYMEPRPNDGVYNLAFAGNIGAAQSVDTIIGAAEILKNEPVRFIIIGGGTESGRLQNLVKDRKITNVEFLGRYPLEKMPEFYRQADAMLVTLQADPVLSLTLPGKVQSYLAAGKPIIGAINGETADTIREADCGFCGPAEDARALADNIRLFIACENKQALGLNARKYYEDHFTRERFVDKLENAMLKELENKI